MNRATCLFSWCVPPPSGMSKGNWSKCNMQGHTRCRGAVRCCVSTLLVQAVGLTGQTQGWDQPGWGLLWGWAQGAMEWPHSGMGLLQLQTCNCSPAHSRAGVASQTLSAVCGCPPWRSPSHHASVCKAELSPDLATSDSCCLCCLRPAPRLGPESEQGEKQLSGGPGFLQLCSVPSAVWSIVLLHVCPAGCWAQSRNFPFPQGECSMAWTFQMEAPGKTCSVNGSWLGSEEVNSCDHSSGCGRATWI